MYSDDLDSVTNNLRDSAKGNNVGYDVAFPLTEKETRERERGEKGEGRREKGERRKEKGEGRREKGEGRREKGERRKEKDER